MTVAPGPGYPHIPTCERPCDLGRRPTTAVLADGARRPSGDRRRRRPAGGAARDRAGAGHGHDRPAGRPHGRGGARHRQDAAARGRGRAGDGRRLHRDRRHGGRGAARSVPGRPVDPRFARGHRRRVGREDRGCARPVPGLDVGTGRPGSRHALARQPAAPHVRPGSRRVPSPGRGTAARDPDRRPPVVGRGQPASLALRGPHRRRQPDLPDVRDPSRGVRGRHRSREPGGRHGTRGGRAPIEARPVLADGHARLPGAGAGRTGRRVRGCRDARAGRGRPVHRRGDGVRVSRGRAGPGDRRGLDPRRERRAAGSLRGEDAASRGGR